MILDKLFLLMSEKQASDIFISAGAPINIKIHGNTMPVNQQVMLPDMINKIAYELGEEPLIWRTAGWQLPGQDLPRAWLGQHCGSFHSRQYPGT